MIMRSGVTKTILLALFLRMIHIIHSSMDKEITKLMKLLNGFWYKQTVQECAQIANGEQFLALGLICYFDETGTDVYQRDFWRHFHLHSVYSIESADIKPLLGIHLDTFLILKTCLQQHTVYQGGVFVGKSQLCQNVHSCLEVLFKPLIGDQGKFWR